MQSNDGLDSTTAWEDLLEQATEDISTYLWATQEWKTETENYTPGYMLLAALSSRARGRRALDQINEKVPLEDVRYQKKLADMFAQADKQFIDFVERHQEEIKKIIEDELCDRIMDLQSDLFQIRQMGDETGFLKNPTKPDMELRHTVHDFHNRFRQMALAGEELTENFSSLLSGQNRNIEIALDDLYDLLGHAFGYLHAIIDLYPAIKRREYGLERWWLEPPEKDEATLEEWVLRLADISKGEDKEIKAYCPDKEQVIAWGLGELSEKKAAALEAHIYACQTCFDLAMDARIANQLATAEPAHAPATDADVLNPLIQIAGKAWEKLEEFLRDWFVPVNVIHMPQLAVVRGALGTEKTTGVEQEQKILELNWNDENRLDLSLPEPVHMRRKSNLIKVPKWDDDSQELMEKLRTCLQNAKYYWGGWHISDEDGLQPLFQDQPNLAMNITTTILPQGKTYQKVVIGISPDEHALKKALTGEKPPEGPVQVIWLIYTPQEAK